MRLRNIIQEKKENTGIVEYFADLVKKHDPKDLLGKMFTPYYGRIGFMYPHGTCKAGYIYDGYGFWYDARDIKGIDDPNATPTWMKLRHGMIVGVGWATLVPTSMNRFEDFVMEPQKFHRRSSPAYYNLASDNKTVRTHWHFEGGYVGEQRNSSDWLPILSMIERYVDLKLRFTAFFDDIMVRVIEFVNEMYDNGSINGHIRYKALKNYYDTKVIDHCYHENGEFMEEVKERFDAKVLPLINDESRP